MKQKILFNFLAAVTGACLLAGCGTRATGQSLSGLSEISSSAEEPASKVLSALEEGKPEAEEDPAVGDLEQRHETAGTIPHKANVSEVPGVSGKAVTDPQSSGKTTMKTSGVSSTTESSKTAKTEPSGNSQAAGTNTVSNAASASEPTSGSVKEKSTSAADSKEAEPVHTHVWKPQTATDKKWVVDQEAWDEQVDQGVFVVCKKCGENFGQGESAVNEAGLHSAETGHAYTSQHIYTTIHHEEVGHEEEVTTITGYKCETCGAVK